MAEKIYVPAIRCFNKRPNQPDFVLGTIIIDVEAFQDWILNEGREYLTDYQGKPQIKLQVLKSDKTGINLTVDTYKKPETTF